MATRLIRGSDCVEGNPDGYRIAAPNHDFRRSYTNMKRTLMVRSPNHLDLAATPEAKRYHPLQKMFFRLDFRDCRSVAVGHLVQ